MQKKRRRRETLQAERQTRETGRGASARARLAAIEIWERWANEKDRTPLDRVVDSEFRSRRYLNSGERRWIGEPLYGSVRFLRRQVFILGRVNLPATPSNVIDLWILAPCGPDGLAGTLAEPDWERLRAAPIASPHELQSALAALPSAEDTHGYLRTTLSFPDDMAAELEAILGAEAIPAAVAFNDRALTTLRVNTLRASRRKVMSANPELRFSRWSPWGLELERRVNIFDLPGFRDGWYEAQDEASQIAVLLSDVRRDQTVVEVGAGAGGKSLALAALLENRGRVVAIETVEKRLEELGKRARRAGAACIEPFLMAADDEGIWQPTGGMQRRLNRLSGAADVVLVDAPCSGSGVLRRNPDTKWRDADTEAFARLQLSLLEQASPLVKTGGALIYVSCAFERMQNEDLVETFLNSEAGSGFAAADAASRLETACRRVCDGSETPEDVDYTSPSAGPHLRTWPHRHGMDAFFAACLVRS